jgi:hypothetical protein
MGRFNKTPGGVLDYVANWEVWLDGDTLAASTWTLLTTLDDADTFAIDSDTNSETAAVVWVSGGILGNTYRLLNHITTAGGREDEVVIKIEIGVKT